MNKRIRTYAVIWAILFALFNVICFVSPNEIAGVSKFGGSFWVGYIFITLAFIGQLVCSYFALKAESLQKMFYNIPLITISYTGLIVMLIVGALAMAIPNLPNWIRIIVCLAVLAFTAISVITAKAAGAIVSDIDEEVQTKTSFIKQLTLDAENLVNRAKAPMLKKICTRVCEAARYSDPVSNKQLSDIENRILEEFSMLTDAVLADDLDLTESSANEVITLGEERNNKCKMLKK